MPTRRKQPPSVNASSAKDSFPPSPSWKGKAVGLLAVLVLLAAIWSTGAFKSFFAGPRTPLPRSAAGLTLGMPMAEVLQKYPGLKKELRPFNNDPKFQIATLTPALGLAGASSMDLLFYIPTGKLYFLSAMWESETAKGIPLEQWAHQYRRWNQGGGGNPESLGNNVLLKEWDFKDSQTEMILRNLAYSDHLQRWQDLRDDTDEPAQDAFAKYRLDGGG
jgi:hypothetical protein